MLTMDQFDKLSIEEKKAYIKTLEKKLARMLMLRIGISVALTVGVVILTKKLSSKNTEDQVTPTE